MFVLRKRALANGGIFDEEEMVKKAQWATIKEAAVVALNRTLLGLFKGGEQYGDPANQLNKMGVDEEKSEEKQREEAVVVVRRSVCPGYKKMGMFKFSAKCKTCGKAKDAH